MPEPNARIGQPRIAPGWVLGAAIVGMSTAGPLVRSSHAHPVVIAFWRLAFSLGVVAFGLLLSGEWRELGRITRRELSLSIAAGLALAAHFWVWNASIQLTTIAASVTLVSMQPAIVALFSALYLRERPARRQVAGIAIAILGAAVIVLPDALSSGPTIGRGALLGNALALAGAFTAAVYFVLGRRLRRAMGLWTYVSVVYVTCFLALGAAAATMRLDLALQSGREVGIFVGLALGPMLLAHTGMNWALRYRPAYVVNLTVLAEPVGASLLAAVLPWVAEVPPGTTFLGGAVVLGGILLASWKR